MGDRPTAEGRYDGDALRRRYLAERDKRLRTDGAAQYRDASGDFADLVADPYVEPGFTRPAIDETVEVLVVGGGMGGLQTAAELQRRGIDDFRIVEQAGDFGGTWYWNRYPGVRCDIEALIYLPLLEEVGSVPSERYATGAEIFAHCQAIGRHFDLYARALFQTRVERMAWDEQAERWIVTTDRGDRIAARFVTVSQGPLAKVKLPSIPGIGTFKGRLFHSARWDYDYTGGDASGGLTKLADKRVGVIGTGATAVQIVPRVADHAEQLYVFQRTPSAIDIRANRPTDKSWLRGQPPGWQRARMDNFLGIVSGKPVAEVLVDDHWGDLFLRFGALMQGAATAGEPLDPHALMQQADYEKMEAIRARVAAEVADPDLAERLQPWYNFLCKRPLFSDDYLPAFNRPNVTLVDTDGRGVERITATGIVANGREYPLDLIILATGFDVGAPPHQVGGYAVTGRGGLTLAERWDAPLRTLHGTQLSGFPNFHIVGGTAQGTTAFNFTHILRMQAEHAADIIAHCRDAGIAALEPTAEAEERWHATLAAKQVDHDHFYEECTPGFLNNEGKFRDMPTFVGGTYGGGPLEYEQLLARWRAEAMAADMDMHPLKQVALGG